jgi:hypothetical protein
MTHRVSGIRFWMPAVLLLTLAVSHTAQADIILFLSQPSYAVGEPVEFALVNGSEHVIAVPNTTWWKITDAKGDVVAGCEPQPQEHEVLPGNYLDSTWDQISCADDRPVPEGRYRLDAYYTSDCCPGLASIEAFFDVGTAAVAPATWGRIKATFSGGAR